MNAEFDITNVVLETPRLILRAWEKSDVSDLFEYAQVDGVGQMAGWQPHESIDVSAEILNRFIQGKKTFALCLKETCKVIGSLGIEQLSGERAIQSRFLGRELGYVLSKDFWGRGLMPEAAKAVIDYCFSVLHYDFLTCGHFVRNTQSRRVIEKCGFRFYTDIDYTTNLGTVEPTRLYVLWNEKKGLRKDEIF